MKKDIWEQKFSDNFQASSFEKLIKKYETYRQDEIIKLLPFKGDVLVDLACGNGELIYNVQERFKSLIGFDIAANRIKNARLNKSKNKKIVFKVIDLDHGIPLKSKSVNVAVCEASIQCIYDVEFFLEEVNRILKLNGIFIIQTSNIVYLFKRFSWFLGKIPRTSSFSGYGDGGVIHYFTYSLFRQLLINHGFKIDCQTNSGVLASFRKVWPSLLASDMIFKAIKIK